MRVDLVLEEAGRRLAIDPSDDDVTEYMRGEADKDQELGGQVQQLLDNAVAREYFRHRLTRLRVLEVLVARLDPQTSGVKE